MKKWLFPLFLISAIWACNLPGSEADVQGTPTETQVAELPSSTPERLEPSATPTHTPTQSESERFLSQVQVTSSELFNAGEDPSDESQRDYAQSYNQADARVIYCQVNLVHTQPAEDVGFTIRAVYYGPGGGVYGEVQIEPVVERGWSDSFWIIGYGWDEPGQWDVGDYRMEVFLEDQEIVVKTFTILKDTPTPEPTLTPTPMPGAVVDTDSLNIRKGPGTEYAIVTGVSRGENLEILGQAYSCGWLKVKTTSGVEGWVSSDLVRFELPCSQIPAAAIPPTPIPLPTVTPTAQAPAGKTISVKIKNDTGGNLTLNLSGPANYSFTFAPGTHTINVVAGTYSYTAWGCGASLSGTKKLAQGDEWTFYCT